MCVVLVGFCSFFRLSHLVQPVSGVSCAFLGHLQVQWLSSAGPVLVPVSYGTALPLPVLNPTLSVAILHINTDFDFQMLAYFVCIYMEGTGIEVSGLLLSLSLNLELTDQAGLAGQWAQGSACLCSSAGRNHCVLPHLAFYIGTKNLNSHSHVDESST